MSILCTAPKRQPCDLPSAQSSASFWHKAPSPLLLGHRSTRHLPLYTDVVIIGSGITGASVAHHLLYPKAYNDGGTAQKRTDVLLLDAREACWGATGRNGGRCQPDIFEHPDMHDAGRFEIRNFIEIQQLVQDKAIDCEFVAHTGVSAIYTRESLEAKQRALENLTGVAPDLARHVRITTSKDELRSLRVPGALGAILQTPAARLWPYKLVAHILEDLTTSTSLHGTFNLQTLTPVTKIECGGHDNATGRISVQTYRGTIRAHKVVLATNGYTSHLLPAFADLIVPCRGQMSSLIPFTSLADENRLNTSLGFEGVGLDGYLVQRPSETGGHLMFGGGGKRGHVLDMTDDFDVDDQTSHYLRTTLANVLHLPEAKRSMQATHMWTGIMGYSSDGIPWVGEVPDFPGIYLAAGYTGHGMPNAWLCGKFVALLALGKLAERDDACVLKAAIEETGLPDPYLITRQRTEKAKQRVR